jgi:hypothetical protein
LLSFGVKFAAAWPAAAYRASLDTLKMEFSREGSRFMERHAENAANLAADGLFSDHGDLAEKFRNAAENGGKMLYPYNIRL